LSRQDIIDICMASAVEEADKQKCCLKCKYSYFSQYQETGLCHNIHMVRGHCHPKVVNEFFRCQFWEIKVVKKEV